MDIMHAVPYVQKHKKHPVTGAPLELKDLTKLTFHKNADGEYECPVLNKTFTVGPGPGRYCSPRQMMPSNSTKCVSMEWQGQCAWQILRGTRHSTRFEA